MGGKTARTKRPSFRLTPLAWVTAQWLGTCSSSDNSKCWGFQGLPLRFFRENCDIRKFGYHLEFRNSKHPKSLRFEGWSWQFGGRNPWVWLWSPEVAGSSQGVCLRILALGASRNTTDARNFEKVWFPALLGELDTWANLQQKWHRWFRGESYRLGFSWLCFLGHGALEILRKFYWASEASEPNSILATR